MLRWLGFTQRHHHHHHRREPVQPDPTRRRRWPCVATPRPLVFVVSLAFFLSHFFSSLSRFWLPTPTNPGASVSMDFIRGVVVSLFGFLWFARIWFDRLLIVWSSFFCVAKTIHFSYFFSTESALVSSIVAEFQGHLRGFLPSFFFTEFFSASPRSAAAEIAKMATARVASIFATRCDTKENPKKRNKRRTKSRGRTLFAWVYLVLRVTDFRNAYGRNSLAAGPQRQWKWKRRSFEGLGKI